MNLARGFLLVMVLLSSACTEPLHPEPSASACLKFSKPFGMGVTLDGINRYNGRSRFSLAPSEPVLVPGSTLNLTASFLNRDECSFMYRDGAGGCGVHVIRVGTDSLQFSDRDGRPPNPAHNVIPKACLGFVGEGAIAPGELYERSIEWDGSIEVWDHVSLERREAWQQRTVWAAPGRWPISYGFNLWELSYPVEQTTWLRVAENDLNRESPLHPRDCRGGRPWDISPFMTAAQVSVSEPSARLGTPITVRFNYTVDLPAPGCYLFWRSPGVSVNGLAALESCDVDVFWIQASNLTVSASVEFQWRGERNFCYPEGGLRPPGRYSLTPADSEFVETFETRPVSVTWT